MPLKPMPIEVRALKEDYEVRETDTHFEVWCKGNGCRRGWRLQKRLWGGVGSVLHLLNHAASHKGGAR